LWLEAACELFVSFFLFMFVLCFILFCRGYCFGFSRFETMMKKPSRFVKKAQLQACLPLHKTAFPSSFRLNERENTIQFLVKPPFHSKWRPKSFLGSKHDEKATSRFV